MLHDVVTFWLERFSNSILHIPRSRALLQSITGSQPVRKFPAFYEARNFITPFTPARHLTLYFSNFSLILKHITNTWPFETHTQMNTPKTQFKLTTSTTFKILYTLF